MIKILILVLVFLLNHTVGFAEVVPVIRTIDTICVFPNFSVSSSNRNAGYLEIFSTTDLIISSNDVWKLQAKVDSIDTFQIYIKYANYGYTINTLDLTYLDIPGASGNAVSGYSNPVTIKIPTDWNISSFNNAQKTVTILLTAP